MQIEKIQIYDLWGWSGIIYRSFTDQDSSRFYLQGGAPQVISWFIIPWKL